MRPLVNLVVAAVVTSWAASNTPYPVPVWALLIAWAAIAAVLVGVSELLWGES